LSDVICYISLLSKATLTTALNFVLFEKQVAPQLVKKSPAFIEPEIHCCVHKSSLLVCLLV